MYEDMNMILNVVLHSFEKIAALAATCDKINNFRSRKQKLWMGNISNFRFVFLPKQ